MIRSRLAFIKPLSLAMLALVFAPCALEVGLRIYDWREGTISQTAPPNKQLETHCWLAHHKLLPLKKIVVKSPDSEATITLRTNSLGLRGADIAIPRPPGIYRILCLGDERTLAAGVDESQTFCVRVQEILQEQTSFQVEVVNGGQPDYCPLLSYLQLKHYLLGLQPDLVILNFDMSDVADDHRHRRHTRMSPSNVPLACSHPALETKQRGTGRRLEDQFTVVKWGKSQLGFLSANASSLPDRGDIDSPLGQYGWLRDNPPDWSVYIEQALSPLEHIGKLTKGSFSRFAVAVCPAPWQISEHATAGKGVRASLGIPEQTRFKNKQPFHLVANFTQQRGLALCDTVGPFLRAEHPEQLYLQNSPEFSPAGHELYARQLAKFVMTSAPEIWNKTPSHQHHPVTRSEHNTRR